MSLIYSVLENKQEIHSDYLDSTIYNLLNQTFELPIGGFSFNVLSISDEYVARPDLISLDAYGDTCYTDIICKLNGISNPFELNAGMEIIIPTAEDIGMFYVEPGDDDNEDNLYKPIASSKINKKRGANEAVVGDSRFKIDAVNGIIIY